MNKIILSKVGYLVSICFWAFLCFGVAGVFLAELVVKEEIVMAVALAFLMLALICWISLFLKARKSPRW